MSQVILITGAGSGFGLNAAKTLARNGHIVYGGLHSLKGSRDTESGGDNPIHEIVVDIQDQNSIDTAIKKISAEHGRLDCVIHNAGHMGMAPAEAFSADQFHHYYDINTVGAHRLNQAVLPLMRKAHCGHIIWVSSSSARGGSGPLLAPYFAAKAAMHSYALTLSTEIACWGIETTIVVPGIFTSGTNHFANAGKPALPYVADEYMQGPLKNADTIMLENVSATFPKDASPQLVADAILTAVEAPRGKKPFRIPVDPFQDGSDEIMALADKWHVDYLRRIGLLEMCSYHAK